MSEIPNAWCANILNTPASNGAFDVYHQNAIEPDGNDFVISFRHLDAVYKISKADGSVVWKLGGVPRPESLTVVGDPLGADPLEGQHDPRVLSDGTLTIHDNGFHPGSPRTARAVRYALDLVARTATLVEQVNDPGTLGTALCCGSARKLPGGDWVMSWGTNDLVTELDSSGNRVFSLTFDNNLFSYRAWPVLPGTVSSEALRTGMDVQYPRGQMPPIDKPPSGAEPPQTTTPPLYSRVNRPAILTKSRAISEAKVALRRKYRGAYRRGTHKRLRCRPLGADYTCSFSFQHGTNRHTGSLTVQATPNGIKTRVRARVRPIK
jgi:hypothetical protein